MFSVHRVSNFAYARVAQWIECFPPKELKADTALVSTPLKHNHFLVNLLPADIARCDSKRFVCVHLAPIFIQTHMKQQLLCQDCVFSRITDNIQTDRCARTNELCENRRAQKSSEGGCGRNAVDYLSRFVEKDYANFPLAPGVWR